jgi:hypothetical protein
VSREREERERRRFVRELRKRGLGVIFTARRLNPPKRMEAWLSALLDIDKRGNKKRLLQLLRSKTPIPAEARWHVADLLERYELRRPRGGRTTPSYDRSPAETLLEAANEAVSRSREEGQTLNAAIEEHARLYGVDPKKLRDYRTGKYFSARRMKKRRLPTGARP